MGVIQRMKCLVGQHERNPRRLTKVDGFAHSTCVGCGRPMIREGYLWRLDARP